MITVLLDMMGFGIIIPVLPKLIGLVASMIAAFGYGLVSSLPMVVGLMVGHGPEGFIMPMLSAIMSKTGARESVRRGAGRAFGGHQYHYAGRNGVLRATVRLVHGGR